ncbi:MAG: histidine kinase [Lachnospiraceae bacterium]|uniref:sensor histidine kinase n=1 Tax=Galactobacillus timonensis TaxID=2041840 RepID=UPI0023F20132|nr:sensor histidine kinase [Galactobacillus timonensis]MCI6753699.1 histidine kinase [Galactobacillus timonensis]MDD7087932.1 histidine kinase [Galactobacillus timonensis]MDY5222897.1 histidine kinase [Lachnospiraceae bacterium]
MKRRLRNTASGKYAIGYFIFAIISVAIVILSFALLNDVRSTYSSQNDYLFVINELEQSVTSLNENVYTAYVSMSHEQIDQYDALRDKCESSLDKSKSASSDYYLREVVDLNNTVMTYLDASDELIRGIREYLETRSVDNLGELQKQYSEQQRIYSYVVIGFQNAYSARLSFLNNMQDQIEDSILRIVYSVTALLIVAGLFAGGYAVKSMRSMKHSFDVLEDGIDAFKKDVRNAPMIELHTSDEFEELADAFNNSQIVIRNQMDSLAESARDKEKLAEMEKENLRIYGKLQKNNLDFLQARINPHFLFNTLNMMAI